MIAPLAWDRNAVVWQMLCMVILQTFAWISTIMCINYLGVSSRRGMSVWDRRYCCTAIITPCWLIQWISTVQGLCGMFKACTVALPPERRYNIYCRHGTIQWRIQEFQKWGRGRILGIWELFWCPFTHYLCFCSEGREWNINCTQCRLTTIKVYVLCSQNLQKISNRGACAQCAGPGSAFAIGDSSVFTLEFYNFSGCHRIAL